MEKHAFSAEDLFIDLNDKYLKHPRVIQRLERLKINRRELAGKIVKDCFYEVLLDIIENNTTFVLPLYSGNYAEIYMQSITGDDFKSLYNNGSFSNIDYIKSQFTGYSLAFLYKNSKGYRKKPIYLGKYLRKLLDKYTNEGRQYG